MKQQKQLQVCSALCYSHYSLLGKKCWMQGSLLPHRFSNWVLEALGDAWRLPAFQVIAVTLIHQLSWGRQAWPRGLALALSLRCCSESAEFTWKCELSLLWKNITACLRNSGLWEEHQELHWFSIHNSKVNFTQKKAKFPWGPAPVSWNRWWNVTFFSLTFKSVQKFLQSTGCSELLKYSRFGFYKCLKNSFSSLWSPK